MEQMYSAFSRAVDTRVNKVRGSGLGLAIVKKIVDLMGGAIGAESKVGKGTTFSSLDLPAAAGRRRDRRAHRDGHHAAGKAAHRARGRGQRPKLRDHRRATARLQGALCARCERAGLLTADRAAAPDEFRAILMDMQMPVMNGLEATPPSESSTARRRSTSPSSPSQPTPTMRTFKNASPRA